MRHVGNVYADFPKSVLQRADGKGIVKVFGVFRVDGEGGYFPEVFAAGYFSSAEISAGILSAAFSTDCG